MPVEITVKGLAELKAKFAKAPKVYDAAEELTMRTSLLVLQESVPKYPPPPEGSSYRRTLTLGRSLGIGGEANIATVKKMGSGMREGRFGTRVKYAQFVIGEKTQAWMHQGRWWTMATVAGRAEAKILRLFKAMAEKLAAWLNSNTP
jgi:hypothetical protein